MIRGSSIAAALRKVKTNRSPAQYTPVAGQGMRRRGRRRCRRRVAYSW